jgi:hypothetical protein
MSCLRIDEEGGRRRREAVECSSQGNNRFGSFGQEGSKLKQGTSGHASQCFGEKLQYMSLLLLLFNSALLHAIFLTLHMFCEMEERPCSLAYVLFFLVQIGVYGFKSLGFTNSWSPSEYK